MTAKTKDTKKRKRTVKAKAEAIKPIIAEKVEEPQEEEATVTTLVKEEEETEEPVQESPKEAESITAKRLVVPVQQPPDGVTKKNGGKPAFIWVHPDRGGGHEWSTLVPAINQTAYFVLDMVNGFLPALRTERVETYFYQEIKVVEDGHPKYLPAPYDPDPLTPEDKTPEEYDNHLNLDCLRDYILYTGQNKSDLVKMGIIVAGIIGVLIVFFLMWNVVAGRK